jgi:hypothetical protein
MISVPDITRVYGGSQYWMDKTTACGMPRQAPGNYYIMFANEMKIATLE